VAYTLKTHASPWQRLIKQKRIFIYKSRNAKRWPSDCFGRVWRCTIVTTVTRSLVGSFQLRSQAVCSDILDSKCVTVVRVVTASSAFFCHLVSLLYLHVKLRVTRHFFIFRYVYYILRLEKFLNRLPHFVIYYSFLSLMQIT
jgi:hypothetical protein